MQLSASRLSAGRASASGPSLEALALAAIRRNNGSLRGVPASNAGLFTDSVGTTPATAVGDVLGLVTDRAYGSGGLGPELVTNGNFAAGTTSWAPIGTGGTTFTASGGVCTISRSGDNAGRPSQTFATVPGVLYAVNVVVTSAATAAVQITGIASSLVTGAAKTVTVYFFATGTSHQISVWPAVNPSSVTLDKVSVREVLGTHATQATTANKPIIASLPNGKRAMKFDGSNDLLNLGPGAVLSNASDHWVCAAFILDVLPNTGQFLSLYSSSNTGNDAVLAPYLYLRDDRLLVATWRDQALLEATVTAGSGNITPGLPYVAHAYKSGTTHGLRLNGVVRGEITRSLGGGTANTANIGMIVRSATTNPFNGKLIVAAGQSTLSAPDRRTIERYLAQQIGAQYLG